MGMERRVLHRTEVGVESRTGSSGGQNAASLPRDLELFDL